MEADNGLKYSKYMKHLYIFLLSARFSVSWMLCLLKLPGNHKTLLTAVFPSKALQVKVVVSPSKDDVWEMLIVEGGSDEYKEKRTFVNIYPMQIIFHGCCDKPFFSFTVQAANSFRASSHIFCFSASSAALSLTPGYKRN